MKKILLSLFALVCATNLFAVDRISVKDFLEKKDAQTVYELAGTVKSIKNTKYGNFYLEQDGSEIYIYGLVTTEDPKKQNLITELGIQEGDKIVVQGAYAEYNGTPEVINAIYVSHESLGQGVDISNTPETAYTVSKAAEIIAAGKGLSTQVYVKGTVLAEGLSVSLQYGNADYYISDGTAKLKVYHGYYLENHKFTSEDQLQDDDEVIVYGLLTVYNDENEFAQGNYLYSKNGQTVDEYVPVTPEIGGIETFENGGFEEWASDTKPTGWVSTNTASSATLEKSSDAHGGNYSCLVKHTDGSNKRLATKEMLLPAGWYTMKFYAKSANDVLAEARPGYAPWDKEKDAMGTYVYGDYTKQLPTNEWTLVTFTFELAAETQLNLVVMNPKNATAKNEAGETVTTQVYGDLLVDDVDFHVATAEEIAAAGVKTISTEAVAGRAYNLAGQRISDNYRGIVILNGKKFIK